MLAAFPVPLLWSWGLPCTPQSTTVIPLECCSGLSLKEVQLRLLMQAVLARGAEPCSVLLVSPSGLLLTDGLSPGRSLCPEPCLRSLSPGSARAGGRGAFLAPGLILLFRGAVSCCSHPPWKGSRVVLFSSPISISPRVEEQELPVRHPCLVPAGQWHRLLSSQATFGRLKWERHL